MENCSCCGHPAGILWSQHQECEEQHQLAEQRVFQGALDCIASGSDITRFVTDIKPMAREGYSTDKNLYFASSTRSFGGPCAKIVAFDQFSDGVGIMHDAASAEPQIFVTRDGWFSCNRITMLAH